MFRASLRLLLPLTLLCLGPALHAQQAASSAIDQARHFQETPAAPTAAVDANGNALGANGGSSSDDSFHRLAYQIYTSGNRQDLKQVVSWNLRYHFTDWAEAAAYFSFGGNRSNAGVFDYNVVSSGGGLSFTSRF